MPHFYLGLCAIAKDETPFLREWVAYHYHIGFEKIYIYDNESQIPVRDSLADFYDMGVFDSYTLQGKAMQLIAYNHCLKNHGDEFEWLAFFDLDEFLCLRQDTDARVLMRDYEAFSALSLNWDAFGSSGHLSRPQGLVTKNYRQSLGYTSIAKCIVRPAQVNMGFTSHHFLYKEGGAVNADGMPAFGGFAPIAVDKVCLNHYSFRSQQDYEEKLNKSDATYGEYNPRSLDSFYHQARQPTEERTAILPAASDVQRMLEHGPLHMRHAITLAETAALSLPTTLSGMAKYIRTQHTGLAETLFALCYARFRHETEFLRMGIALCRQCGRHERALALAQEALAQTPDDISYIDMYECLTDCGRHDDAVRIGEFLREVAGMTEDSTCKQRIFDFIARHSPKPLAPA